MANQRFDPLPAFCFSVKLDFFNGGSDGGAVAFCKSVNGLKVEREVIPYKEGGNNVSTRKLVGPTNFTNVVLKRGWVGPEAGRVLAKSIMDMLKADEVVRFLGTITQLGPDLQPVYRWKLKNCWVCKWEGPDLDASKSELAFETIEIAHEGFTIEGLA